MVSTWCDISDFDSCWYMFLFIDSKGWFTVRIFVPICQMTLCHMSMDNCKCVRLSGWHLLWSRSWLASLLILTLEKRSQWGHMLVVTDWPLLPNLSQLVVELEVVVLIKRSCSGVYFNKLHSKNHVKRQIGYQVYQPLYIIIMMLYYVVWLVHLCT